MDGRAGGGGGGGGGGTGSFIDRLILFAPFEMHLPGYQFLDPGTHLVERLRRGQRGKNPLDNARLEHDISYSNKKITNHIKADRLLAE
ncbi:hypothetical protein [Escherichia coli]|uniref:hypothetical protein n=1 Tax=Escherichia coli TaxID=562 RepID=UPI003967C2A4